MNEARQEFIKLIKEGRQSGEPLLVDEAFWKEKKDRLARKVTK